MREAVVHRAASDPSESRPPAPLVSCLLLTANRRHFVPHAIRHFLEQDYPERELIVLEDGDQSVEDLIPRDPRIRYVRLPGRSSVGAKRNLGCEQARGELIAHWDDDDWSAPWRLSYQVTELLRHGADVCGLRQLYFWGPHRQEVWEYTYPADEPPWVAGGTMLYRKSFWSRNPFPDVAVGEDNAFLWSDAGKKVLPLVDRRFYVAMIHPGNTSPKMISPERWSRATDDELRQIMGLAWGAYDNLVFGPARDGTPRPHSEGGRVSESAIAPFAVARRDHLGLVEFSAFNDEKTVPWMRRWELPFAILQSRLSDTMALFDCSINPAGLGQWIAELYPHILYRHQSAFGPAGFQAALTAPEGAFDRVFCLNTLEHLLEPQREALMETLAAKLKPGGWLIVTMDCYFESARSRKEWLETGLVRADGEEVFNGFNRVTAAGLASLAERHGLMPLSPPPPEPHESDDTLYLNAPPLEHGVLGAIFSKGAYREPQGKKVLLALLTWNTREPSVESLQALVREARMLIRLGHQAEITVVDNGSTDGTADELRRLDREIGIPHQFILNPENTGNSRARNQIIDHMLAGGFDYILFVDGDIEIVPMSSFAMLRYLEAGGSGVGCLGAYSFGCTPDREQTTPSLYSLANCQIQSSDVLAWTQYGLFGRRMFEDGIRFEVAGPFGEPGHGLEDVDLAFQMNQRGYLNHYFSGICYLHRNLSSSVGILSHQGLEPTDRYYRRKEFVLRKWENAPGIADGPLYWVRQARAPWSEDRRGRRATVRFSPTAPPIEVPGEVLDWADRSTSDMLDRTELIALAALLGSFQWRDGDLVVEIGAYLGRTTVFLAKTLEALGHRTKILSIDAFERCEPDALNPQGNYPRYVENIRANGVEDRCLALAAFSADAAAAVPDRAGVLIIDGSHHYESVRADLDLYMPKVVPAGLVFIDDYGPAYPDVIRAVDEFLASHPEWEILAKEYYVVLRRPGRR